MPFGVVSGVDRDMGVLDGNGDRRRGRSSFGGYCGASHSNQWELCCVIVREGHALPKLFWGDLFQFYFRCKHTLFLVVNVTDESF